METANVSLETSWRPSNRKGVAISGVRMWNRSVKEKVEIKKLQANRTITGNTYQKSIAADNKYIPSQSLFTIDTILYKHYIGVSFTLKISFAYKKVF